MNNHIFLIGFMGSGKSTIARGLSKKTGKNILEMDEEIVRLEGMPITEIFAQKGEPYFREIETGLLRSLAEKEDCIVSCGGGVPMREENVKIMKELGKVVYLAADPSTILERVKRSTARPLLNGNMNREFIADMMEKRRPAYIHASDIQISTDGRSVGEIASGIIRMSKYKSK